MDAATPSVRDATGVDAVESMTELPADLSRMLASDRALVNNVWTQPNTAPARALLGFTATTLGVSGLAQPHDVTSLTAQIRMFKDAGEIDLLKKASAASVLGQRVMMQWWVKAGMTERAVAGGMTAVWMENGCERPSYAPIVGSGINSTILHYSANDRTMQDGDILLVDAACEFSMYAADITRTVPVNGHFTPRQREIYDIVLGAQQAAIDAFVAGKSTHQRSRSPRSEFARHRGLQLHQHTRQGSARPAARPILVAWTGAHLGDRRARPSDVPGCAETRHGLHHRARCLHSRRETGRAHRVRFHGWQQTGTSSIWMLLSRTPRMKWKQRCTQNSSTWKLPWQIPTPGAE